MITQDGMGTILTTGIIALLAALVCPLTLIVTVPVLLIVLWFFRDPDRTPDGAGIVSPADGKVIEICETEHPYTGKAVKIGIFMNLFSVHVNRMPSSGIIEYLSYSPGKKWFADAPKASDVNEHMYIGYRSEKGPVLMTQIAGLVARRIVCRLKKGDVLDRAQRFGMIRLGSKVDVYLPSETMVKVKIGQKVCAGKTVIAD